MSSAAGKRRPGRPEFKPTKAQRANVEIAAGGGMPHEEIALALGITRPTLRKHFEDELTRGAMVRRIDVHVATYDAATVKRNASAARQYLSGTPEAAAPAPDPVPAGDGAAAPELGKKAAANEAAKTAADGTAWDAILRRAPRPAATN